MNDVRLKLSPPWITYIHQLEALFDGDPLIAFNTGYDDNGPFVTLAVGDPDKATAIAKLLPTEKHFGNVTLRVTVDGKFSNRAFVSPKELFDTAFAKNPAYAYSVSPADEGYWFFSITYVVFKNCVVQFFNDNLNDAHGLVSTLYQDIAAEVFADAGFNGVYYCTDVETGKLGMPLGEWP